jgi:hypothetical protein
VCGSEPRPLAAAAAAAAAAGAEGAEPAAVGAGSEAGGSLGDGSGGVLFDAQQHARDFGRLHEVGATRPLLHPRAAPRGEGTQALASFCRGRPLTPPPSQVAYEVKRCAAEQGLDGAGMHIVVSGAAAPHQ